MNKVIRSEQTNRYFVQGQGFVGTQATATRFVDFYDAEETQDFAKSMGLGRSYLEDVEDVPEAVGEPVIQQNIDGSSWAVNFVRKQDANGGVKHNNLNPSPRRFRTKEEAEHHALRFVKIESHVGFWVSPSTDHVNAYVNQVTGKTNPVIGRARTNR
jgi:hypothetical protein